MPMIDFIKGHMGGNELILLLGAQIPQEREIEIALHALDPPNIRGDEAGLLYKGKGDNNVKVKIIGVGSRHFISMCGGLTQVIGKALLETDLSGDLNIELKRSVTELKRSVTKITLETAVGTIPLEITSDNGRVKQVLTGMNPFVDECYGLGIQPITVAGVNAMRVGKFLVVNADEIRRIHPTVQPNELDETTVRLLKELQDSFDSQGYLEKKNADFALYDLNPRDSSNNGRVIFPHGISALHIEPACGTGTVAVGLAMLESGEIDDTQEELELTFESGGNHYTIGGPELTKLNLEIADRKIIKANFTHSLVEILATGKLLI